MKKLFITSALVASLTASQGFAYGSAAEMKTALLSMKQMPQVADLTSEQIEALCQQHHASYTGTLLLKAAYTGALKAQAEEAVNVAHAAKSGSAQNSVPRMTQQEVVASISRMTQSASRAHTEEESAAVLKQETARLEDLRKEKEIHLAAQRKEAERLASERKAEDKAKAKAAADKEAEVLAAQKRKAEDEAKAKAKAPAKSMSSEADALNKAERELKALQDKVTKAEEDARAAQEALAHATSGHEAVLKALQEEHDKLKQQHDELKVKYNNTCENHLKPAKQQIEALQNELAAEKTKKGAPADPDLLKRIGQVQALQSNLKAQLDAEKAKLPAVLQAMKDAQAQLERVCGFSEDLLTVADRYYTADNKKGKAATTARASILPKISQFKKDFEGAAVAPVKTKNPKNPDALIDHIIICSAKIEAKGLRDAKKALDVLGFFKGHIATDKKAFEEALRKQAATQQRVADLDQDYQDLTTALA